MPLFVGRDDPDFVVGGLEADPGSADVVNDDGIEFLTRQFLSPVRECPVAGRAGTA